MSKELGSHNSHPQSKISWLSRKLVPYLVPIRDYCHRAQPCHWCGHRQIQDLLICKEGTEPWTSRNSEMALLINCRRPGTDWRECEKLLVPLSSTVFGFVCRNLTKFLGWRARNDPPLARAEGGRCLLFSNKRRAFSLQRSPLWGKRCIPPGSSSVYPSWLKKLINTCDGHSS